MSQCQMSASLARQDRKARAFARSLSPGDRVAYWNTDARQWEETHVVQVKRGPFVRLLSPPWWVSHLFVGPVEEVSA